MGIFQEASLVFTPKKRGGQSGDHEKSHFVQGDEQTGFLSREYIRHEFPTCRSNILMEWF